MTPFLTFITQSLFLVNVKLSSLPAPPFSSFLKRVTKRNKEKKLKSRSSFEVIRVAVAFAVVFSLFIHGKKVTVLCKIGQEQNYWHPQKDVLSS